MPSGDALRVYLEVSPKKAFATAVDWPGWSRSGRTADAAIAALLAYRDRYAAAVGERLPPADADVDVVQQLEGAAGTEFGVPSVTCDVDRQALDRSEAERRAGLVRAAWASFDRIAAAAPAELRKGPRGGGRDTAKIVAHVVGADAAYTRELGLRMAEPDPADRPAVEAMRKAMLDVLARPSDGGPIAKRWTPRYAAQRIAWHALDHAWEIEDRSEPA